MLLGARQFWRLSMAEILSMTGVILSYGSRWMSDHELTVGPNGRLLPIIPARGNHDGGKLFNEIFAFPDRRTRISTALILVHSYG